MSFAKRWEKKDDPSTYDKMVEKIRPSDPLKTKLEASIRRVELENQRLDQTYDRLQKQDKVLFDKAVECKKVHDDLRASVYTNEIAEIRKLERMILQTKLALEVVVLRGRTSTELGDIAVSLLPMVETMNGLKMGIATINPQTEKRLGELDDLLSGMVVNVGLVTMDAITFDDVNDGGSKILGEAQLVAESKINNGFPELPGNSSDQSLK